MRDHNHRTARKSGFYGLDVYSLWQSMELLVDYLEKADPAAARIAERALGCFEGAGRNEQQYAMNSLSKPCREEVVRLLREMRLRAPGYNHDPEAALNTMQNAHIAVEAEKYYSNMVLFDDQTWNIRDRHMMDSLNRILQFHGPDSKAIVWEHNTHVGDARFTSMSDQGMFNIGQLVREQYPGENYIVGFGSFQGSVIAASAWGAPMQEMELPPAREGSVEYLLHHQSDHNRYMIFGEGHHQEFMKKLPHRAIGVVYDPSEERHNYVPTVLARRYDAFVFIDETVALHPLHVMADNGLVPDTYPFEY
jgi:erythromycin esterase-like protein